MVVSLSKEPPIVMALSLALALRPQQDHFLEAYPPRRRRNPSKAGYGRNRKKGDAALRPFGDRPLLHVLCPCGESIV